MHHYHRLARNITTTLFIAHSLGSAGFLAAGTVSSIVGAHLSGRTAWAGLPTAIYLLGSAVAAFGWGHANDWLGRRGGLVLGLCLGMIGGGLAGTAVVVASFGLFLAGLALMGTAQSALQLARFAAAEVHVAAERGRAISTVVLGGTLGSIFGPLLVGPAGRWSRRIGVDELAGPYGASLILLGLAALVVFRWLRPDPRDLGRDVALHMSDGAGYAGPARALTTILRVPAAGLAVATMICGQLTMVMLMVITAVHMQQHHHALPSISVVISAHTFGMSAFSLVSGRLLDQWGRIPVLASGAGALVLACGLAPLSPTLVPVAVALFLLGLGWNFCFVGGSSLLADQLSPAERARTQGVNDLLIGLVSAAGSLGSGLVFATIGYAGIALLSALVALIPIVLVAWWHVARRSFVPAP